MKWAIAVASLAAALVVSVDAQDPARPPLFRLTTDAVRIEVFVRNREHKSVTGLTAADFEIFDNDIKQEVTDILYGQIPIDVTVALDVSFSVKGRTLEDLRRAVGLLMRDLDKDDRLRLLVFNSRVNRAVDFTRDIAAVDRAISGVTAGGGTSVYDTLSVALVSASNTDRRQLVMCFTDDVDTNSTTGAEELVTIAQRTRATLAFVVPPAPARIVIPIHPREQLLNQLIAETGGSRIDISSDLGTTFRQVLSDFRTAYVIHFRPNGVNRDGFHPLRVSVRRPGATVLMRRGYFGG